MASDSALSDDTILWRYIRLNSFIELLGGTFVESRADVFDDAAEGAYGIGDAALDPQLLQRLDLQPRDEKAEFVRCARSRVTVTAWFEYERESYGMWRVYGRPRESVAIETTVGRLRELFTESDTVRIARVRYEPMPHAIADLFTPFLYKRPEFVEEREIRSIHVYDEPLDEPIVTHQLTLEQLDRFLVRIIVAPQSRPTFFHAVEKVVRGVFQHDGKTYSGDVVASSLDADLIA